MLERPFCPFSLASHLGLPSVRSTPTRQLDRHEPRSPHPELGHRNPDHIMGWQVSSANSCELSRTKLFNSRLTTPKQAFAVYQRIFYGSVSSSQRKLKKQILVDKAELLKTSSQDEFAKWAKLRRKVDKGLADLEKLSAS